MGLVENAGIQEPFCDVWQWGAPGFQDPRSPSKSTKSLMCRKQGTGSQRPHKLPRVQLPWSQQIPWWFRFVPQPQAQLLGRPQSPLIRSLPPEVRTAVLGFCGRGDLPSRGCLPLLGKSCWCLSTLLLCRQPVLQLPGMVLLCGCSSVSYHSLQSV